MSDLLDEPVITIAENVRAGHVSAVDVANMCLGRIAERDGAFHAFLWTSPDALIEQARNLDEAPATAHRGLPPRGSSRVRRARTGR